MAYSSYYVPSSRSYSGYSGGQVYGTYWLADMTVTASRTGGFGGPWSIYGPAAQTSHLTSTSTNNSIDSSSWLPHASIQLQEDDEDPSFIERIVQWLKWQDYELNQDIARFNSEISSIIGACIAFCQEILYPDVPEGNVVYGVGPFGALGGKPYGVPALAGPAKIGEPLVLGPSDYRIRGDWLAWLEGKAIPGRVIQEIQYMEIFIRTAPSIDFQLMGVADDIAYHGTFTAQELRMIFREGRVNKTTFWMGNTKLSPQEVQEGFPELLKEIP